MFAAAIMSTLDWSRVKGLLFDLDGVFFVGDRLVPGAVETIEYIRGRGYPCRFTTNTTSKSLDTFHAMLTRLKLPIAREEVFTAPMAAIRYLRELGDPSCLLLMTEDTRCDFAEFRQSETQPEVLVIGDIGSKWDYKIMNRLFNLVMNGSKIIALHKGRYWQMEDGLRLDSGAFVAGLEYATGRKATAMGKPSTRFFELALADLGVEADRAVMIGDDVVNDVGGAQNVGVSGVLVRTGKYLSQQVAMSGIVPDDTIDSVAELMKLLP